MDASIHDHSDSDSGDSWTLIENTPTNEDVQESPENQTSQERNQILNVDKDEDTDGISIISDSDHESSTPCELIYEYDKPLEENHPTEQHKSQFISLSSLQPNNNDLQESMRSDDDLLEESSGKHKTYVHRRNKRLSTVLNIIMLGSVITAAGVAIGHMWGAKNDCSLHTTPSVNKILSNLYKLQEENALLRSKLKELTLANIQGYHKPVSEKLPLKQQRCKKVYEESINKKNTDKPTKCLDINTETILNAPMMQPEHEKEFLHDIDKLKQVYQQNKSWLDEEITRRIKREQTSKMMKDILKSTSLNTVEDERIDDKNYKPKNLVSVLETGSDVKIDSGYKLLEGSSKIKDYKISYADSLRTDIHIENTQKENTNEQFDKGSKEANRKKNRKGDKSDIIPELSSSEYEFQKDNRYTMPKNKQEVQKHDRQKSHKKQKRKNKYEKWEIKDVHIKDYDDFSRASSQDNEYVVKKPVEIISEYETNMYNDMNQQDIQNIKKLRDKVLKEKFKNNISKNDKNKERDSYKDLDWYEKRSAFRSEARKKITQELFGETTQNKARWYFRRMRKREQCRAKGDNDTYRKFTKHDKNYKMKH